MELVFQTEATRNRFSLMQPSKIFCLVLGQTFLMIAENNNFISEWTVNADLMLVQRNAAQSFA